MGIVRSLSRTCCIALLFVAVADQGALGEPWPLRPVTMIVPFGAGSGLDVLGRVPASSAASSDFFGYAPLSPLPPGEGAMSPL